MSRQTVSEQLNDATKPLKMPRDLSLLRQLKVSSALHELEQQLQIAPSADHDLLTRLANVKRKVQVLLVTQLPDPNEPLSENTELGREQLSDRRKLLTLIAEFGDLLNESDKWHDGGVGGRGRDDRPSAPRGALDEEPVPFAAPIIKLLIGESGLSQNEIGRRSRIPKHDLSRYLSNSIQMRLKHVRSIAGALGVQAEDVVRLAFDAFLEDMQRPSH